MASKEYRNMKVYEQSGYHYKSTLAIMLKGARSPVDFGFAPTEAERRPVTQGTGF